jgi:signal transduction histidine kinase
MLVLTATGDAERLPDSHTQDDALERVASELLYPLTTIRMYAEGMLRQMHAAQGDPFDIDAARTLIHSVERMSRLVQVRLEESQSEPD